MPIVIYTYSNPYKLNYEPYWALIKKSFHLCVSQTMVNGLCDQYKDFYKGKLSTINRFINNLYHDWESDEIKISQLANIDNVIDYMTFDEYVEDIDDEDIKLSLIRNRGYVLQSIRIMYEMEMNPNDICIEKLTYEQKCVVAIYKEILSCNNKLFFLKKNFLCEEIDRAIEQTIQDSLKDSNKDYSDIIKQNIVIHGIHQFSPIMLKTIEALSKYKNVIIIFNYQQDYKNVYQTWLDIYSCFESKINFSEHNFINDTQEFKGGIIADNMASMIAGNTSTVDLTKKFEVIEFDNQTEFAGYIAKKFEDATKKRELNYFKHSVLYYMDEQVYSANSDTNQILKIYFPEQFGEREFLDYPIGHFFLSIINMWDPESKTMCIKDIEDVVECLSCGIISGEDCGTLISIFDRCRLYVSKEITIKGIIKKLKKLKYSLDFDEDQNELTRLDYFNITKEEIDNLIFALKELNKITEYFFEDFNDQKNDFRKFYKKIADVLKTKILDKSELDDEFKDIVSRVLVRLNEVDSIEANASFECLRDTMRLYLKQSPVEGKGANWIVRNFEQIDGDVLRSNNRDDEKIYHFACLSDQDMSITHKDEFPWPLDVSFFEIAQDPIDWKYQVYVTSRLQYKNFRRYALFYGLVFSKSKIKLSYVKNEKGVENDLYYLLKILNINIIPYTPEQVKNIKKDVSYIEIEHPVSRSFKLIDFTKFKLCEYRFLLDSIIEEKSIYKDEYLIKNYLAIVLENKLKREHSGRLYTKDIADNYLDSYLKNDDYIKSYFPFVDDLDIHDIRKKINASLKKKFAKYRRFKSLNDKDHVYMTQCEEFLKLPKENDLNKELQEILKNSRKEEINHFLNDENSNKTYFKRKVNWLCDYCAEKEVCIEIYGSNKRKKER